MCELLCAVILVFILLAMVSMIVRGDSYETLYDGSFVSVDSDDNMHLVSRGECRCNSCQHLGISDTMISQPMGYPKNKHETKSSTMQVRKDRAIMRNKNKTNIHQQNRARFLPTHS